MEVAPVLLKIGIGALSFGFKKPKLKSGAAGGKKLEKAGLF